MCTYVRLDLIQPYEENEKYSIYRKMSVTRDHCVKQSKLDRKTTRNLGPLEEQKMLSTAWPAPATLLADWLAGLLVLFIVEVGSQLHSSGWPWACYGDQLALDAWGSACLCFCSIGMKAICYHSLTLFFLNFGSRRPNGAVLHWLLNTYSVHLHKHIHIHTNRNRQISMHSRQN